MRTCGNCGASVSPQDRFCAGCGARFATGDAQRFPAGGRSAPPSSKNGVLYLVVAVAFALLLAIGGGIAFSILRSGKAAPTLASAQGKPGNGSFTDPKTAMQMTIEKVITDAHGDQFKRPIAGTRFLMLYIRFMNHGTQTRTSSPLDVLVVGSGGQTYSSETVLPSMYTQLHQSDVPAGRQRAGWAGFQVPSNMSAATVTWTDSSAINPAAAVGRYNLAVAAAAHEATVTVDPQDPAIVAAIRAYQQTLDDVYGPSYSYSMVGEVATGMAAAAIQCVVEAGPNSLIHMRSYLVYSGTVDQFQSATVNGSPAAAVVRIQQQITTHASDGAVLGTTAADFTITFSLGQVNGSWRVSDYSWVGADGSTGGAAKDARPCPALVPAPQPGAPAVTSVSPSSITEHYDVADYTEQGIKLDVVFMGRQFGEATLADQRRIWLYLQICASSAGLPGVVVPVSDAGVGEFNYLAPVRWQPYFGSVGFADLQSRVNKTLTCHF